MSEYRIFAADLEKDRETVITVWRRNLADVARLEEKYAWHFLNNPFGCGRCWLLENDGRIVGATSLGIRPLQVGDTTITAGVACDLAVDKEHRFLQPAVLLQKELLRSADVRMVYGLPNLKGTAVLKRAGYQGVCEVHRYARVLSFSGYLKRHVRLRPVTWLAGAAVDPVYRAVSSLHERSNGRYVAALLSEFDERFDELWDRVKSEYSLLSLRSSRLLTWRYRDCPLRQYRTVGLLSADHSRLLGYLIYYVEDNCAVCDDLFVASGGDAAGCLLTAWIEQARRTAVSSLTVTCSFRQPLRRELARLGFAQRTAPAAPAQPRKQIREPGRLLFGYGPPDGNVMREWSFTLGDLPYS